MKRCALCGRQTEGYRKYCPICIVIKQEYSRRKWEITRGGKPTKEQNILLDAIAKELCKTRDAR